jgi:hypothetical protein
LSKNIPKIAYFDAKTARFTKVLQNSPRNEENKTQCIIHETSNNKNRCPDMQRHTVELNNVIYNATSQRFEALATVHGGTETRKFACAIDAPIDMSFEDASVGLTTQALRRHSGRGGLSSSQVFNPTLAQRTIRAAAPTKRNFDPFDMLRRLAA